MEDIENVIKNTNEKNQDNINWTKVWSKKYTILEEYKNIIDSYKKSIKRAK